MSDKGKGFYSGLLTAIIVVKSFDQPVITKEIVNTLSDDERREFIQFARDNGELKLSGLDEYIASEKEG